MHPSLSADFWPASARRLPLSDCLSRFAARWPALVSLPAWQVAHELADWLEENGTKGDEPQFHNREHIADVLMSLEILVAAEPITWDLTDVASLLVAMIAHDFAHPGRPNQSRRELEAKACRDIAGRLTALPSVQQRQIYHIILSTDPADYTRFTRPLSSGDKAQKLARIGVSADLLASILPLRGFYLGHQLAQELSVAQHPAAEHIGTLNGRAGFLANCPRLSAGAEKIGLNQLINAQLRVISTLNSAARARIWSPNWGNEFAARVEAELSN